jgi:hypothetical protein
VTEREKGEVAIPSMIFFKNPLTSAGLSAMMNSSIEQLFICLHEKRKGAVFS